MRKILLTALCLCSSAFAAEADFDPYGTFEVNFNRTTVQGTTQACHLTYKAAIQNGSYEPGAVYAVVGNLGVGIGETRKTMVSTLKVTVNKIDLKNPDKSTPKKPYFAYLKAPNGENDAKSFIKSMDSDTPGGLFSVFNIDEKFSAIYGQMLQTDKVSVVFNLAKNAMDIEVPLDLTVASINEKGKRIHSKKAVDQFHACAKPLFQEVLSKVEKK